MLYTVFSANEFCFNLSPAIFSGDLPSSFVHRLQNWRGRKESFQEVAVAVAVENHADVLSGKPVPGAGKRYGRHEKPSHPLLSQDHENSSTLQSGLHP